MPPDFIVERVVLEVTNATLAELPHAIQETEPFFGFSEFGDSNIDFWLFVQANNRIGSFILKSELIKRIHARINQEGIETNYPVCKVVPSTPNGSLPVAPAQQE